MKTLREMIDIVEAAQTDEGIVDTIRAQNYKRLANRSSKKALAAQDKADEYDFDNVDARAPHEQEFMKQMRARRQRERKADDLGYYDVDETVSEEATDEAVNKINELFKDQ